MSLWPFSLDPAPVPPVETRFRRIRTPIPAPGTRELMAELDRFECRSMHGQLPVVWDRAEGFQVFDRHGNAWIDFTSSIFVANAGHANPRVAQAVADAMANGTWHAYTYATEIRARYLRRLMEAAPAPLGKAWLASSGSEASECGLRLMKLYARSRGKRRAGIICFDGAYHGRTMGAALVSGSEQSRAWIGLDDPAIHRLPFPFPWDVADGQARAREDIARLTASGIDPARDLAGIFIESYQGWAAAFYPDGYVQAMAEFAAANDILLGFDDIQGGFARTGRMFAYEHYGVAADIVCLGKGISSSLPLAATLARADVMDLFSTGSMAATHSAHPLCCAAALANLEVIAEERLVEQAARRGDILMEGLHAFADRFPGRVAQVSGRGMIAALLLKDPRTGTPDGETATRVCLRALQKGLILVHTGREAIKVGPPLTIPDEALREGLAVLGEAMAEIVAEQETERRP